MTHGTPLPLGRARDARSLADYAEAMWAARTASPRAAAGKR